MPRSQSHARPSSPVPNSNSEIETLKAKMVEKEAEIKNHLADKEQLIQTIQGQAKKIDALTREQDEKRMQIKQDFWSKVSSTISLNPMWMRHLHYRLLRMQEKRYQTALNKRKNVLKKIQETRDKGLERPFPLGQIFWWIIAAVTFVLILGVGAWFIHDHREREINAWKSRFSETIEKTKGDK